MNSSPPSSPPLKAASVIPSQTPSRTPSRRAFSAETPSGRLSLRTPLDRSVTRDLRASIRRGTPASAGRSNAPTPHAKAARRALDQRRTAMFTPGKNRRRSLMNQRETPMDILRNLGRVLAPTSRPVATSSSSSPGDKASVSLEKEEQSNLYDDGDDDDDLPIDRPRLSLPLGEDVSSSSSADLRPPRLSQIDDENFTAHSIELPRRFDNQSGIGRLSRGSLGSVRVSDFYNADETEETGQQSDFFPGLLEDLQANAGADNDLSFERIDADQTRRFTVGRESDFNFQIPADVGEQTTFVLSDPAADFPATSPIIDRSVTEAAAAEAQEPGGDVADYSDSDAGGPGFDIGGFDYEAGGVEDHSSINEEEEPLPLIPTTHRTTVAELVEIEERSSRNRPAKKRKRISRHGIEYPPLPSSFVKKAAQTALQSSGLSNQRLSADTLDALTQASEWFFEQLGDDLGAYADHAKRKTIEESDVSTLMKRQRQIGSRSTMFSLAQRHLPRELLQELRMPVPQPTKQRKAKRGQVQEDDDDQRDVAEYT